jgi:hypothetical protein
MPKLDISKTELNKRKIAQIDKKQKYVKNYQKENYKFVNIQFRLDDENDQKILEYLEQQETSRAVTIKNILYKHILENKD